MKRIRENPQRFALTNELHARPYALLEAPERASHFAFLSGEDAAEASRTHLLALCDRYGIDHPPPDAAHFQADMGRARLKWERHTEFITYTVFDRGPFDAPFDSAAAEQLPAEWLEEAPGELIVAIHVALTGKGHEPFSADRLGRLFAPDSLCSSFVTDGAAQIWTDFRLHEDGFSHILVRDINLAPRQGGRLVQRLLEIETYRTLALLALPLAREIGPQLTRIGRALTDLTEQMDRLISLEDERQLLKRLVALSSEIEGLSVGMSYRFSAARAYHALVGERIAELRETRAEGFQTIREFMERRLAPGMRTCESVVARQQALSDRANRAANLLRTRVDIELEGQNPGSARLDGPPRPLAAAPAADRRGPVRRGNHLLSRLARGLRLQGGRRGRGCRSMSISAGRCRSPSLRSSSGWECGACAGPSTLRKRPIEGRAWPISLALRLDFPAQEASLFPKAKQKCR